MGRTTFTENSDTLSLNRVLKQEYGDFGEIVEIIEKKFMRLQFLSVSKFLVTKAITSHNSPQAFSRQLQKHKMTNAAYVRNIQTGKRLHQTKFDNVLTGSLTVMHVVEHSGIVYMDRSEWSHISHRK